MAELIDRSEPQVLDGGLPFQVYFDEPDVSFADLAEVLDVLDREFRRVQDGVLAVDAITADGRHVDPFTGKEPDLDLTDSRGEGLGQIRQDYGNRIRMDRHKAFRKPQGLQEFLLRYHERTGRPEDELVAFDVFWVRDKCPQPGELRPYDNQAIPILSYRRPNYRPGPGQPPLPPPLKEQSAGD